MEKQKEDAGIKMITYSQLTANRVHSLLKANDFEGYFALLDQFEAETQKYLGEFEFEGGKAIHWAAYHGNSDALKKLLSVVPRWKQPTRGEEQPCTLLLIIINAR